MASGRTELVGAVAALYAPFPLRHAMDASYVTTTYGKWSRAVADLRRKPWALRPDGDLWECFHDALVVRGGTATFALDKVKAHLTHDAVALGLIDEERFQRIAHIPACGHITTREPGNRISALAKPIGVVKGISDVPWHKDCSLGRHSYECCGLTVGISVTGANAESGQLRVLPGSHRALVWPAPCIQPGLDLQPVDLPTQTGDITVHLSCTQHMSQPPLKQTRKVLYTGFGQVAEDVELAAANHGRMSEVRHKTHTSVSQQPGYLGD